MSVRAALPPVWVAFVANYAKQPCSTTSGIVPNFGSLDSTHSTGHCFWRRVRPTLKSSGRAPAYRGLIGSDHPPGGTPTLRGVECTAAIAVDRRSYGMQFAHLSEGSNGNYRGASARGGDAPWIRERCGTAADLVHHVISITVKGSSLTCRRADCNSDSLSQRR